VNPLGWIDDELARLRQEQLLRRRIVCRTISAASIEIDNRPLVHFATNDYLGLACDPRVIAAAGQRGACWGASASPLITGRQEAHEQLEQELARFEGSEAALLFATGFAANVGAITALVDRHDAVFSDGCNHASIIDGCRLSRAKVFVYDHADLNALEDMLRRAQGFRRRLIVTDGLFSMDGDLAPLAELAELADRHQAMLMVDEAHATGVFGALGRGAAEHCGVQERIHVRVGTLSKALGSAGGFVAGSKQLVDWLANRARTYVFSTAPPAANCRAALEALRVVAEEPHRRHVLLARAEQLRKRLADHGWNVGASTSQIVPLIVGDEAAALALAAELAAAGFWVPAIRPPSVAPGTARLRISVTFAHTAEMIELLTAALARLADRNTAGTAQA
jgi:8-amino-7-oxononanoate synthase